MSKIQKTYGDLESKQSPVEKQKNIVRRMFKKKKFDLKQFNKNEERAEKIDNFVSKYYPIIFACLVSSIIGTSWGVIKTSTDYEEKISFYRRRIAELEKELDNQNDSIIDNEDNISQSVDSQDSSYDYEDDSFILRYKPNIE